MSTKSLFRSLGLLITLASLSACTGMRGPEISSPTDAPATAESADIAVAPTTASSNPAVIALLDNARVEASAGRLPTATAAVERALRIEPRNPVLWQELANKPLRAKNWRIISEARALRGDREGAEAALAHAKALESESE